MNTDYSKRLRRARKKETIPVYYGIKRAFERAIPSQPEKISLVSVENGVWGIFADGTFLTRVFGQADTVFKAARLVAQKTGCKIVWDDAYASMTGILVSVIQFKVKDERFGHFLSPWDEPEAEVKNFELI